MGWETERPGNVEMTGTQLVVECKQGATERSEWTAVGTRVDSDDGVGELVLRDDSKRPTTMGWETWRVPEHQRMRLQDLLRNRQERCIGLS